MKKFVKIAAIVVAVILAVALIVPFALRGKIADIVKREANEMLAAKLDFEKLDISLLRHWWAWTASRATRSSPRSGFRWSST